MLLYQIIGTGLAVRNSRCSLGLNLLGQLDPGWLMRQRWDFGICALKF